MEAAVLHGVEDLRLEERPMPQVEDGALLARVRACAICGSDLRILHEGSDRITEPRIIGHEISGEVIEVGRGVDQFVPGDRISVGADIPCGNCEFCNSGQSNCCETNLATGYQYDGGFAEYILLEPNVVSRGPVQTFPNSLPYEVAALAEPLACCINGYERSAGKPDGVVVIFGAGPIGLMLATLGQYYGASNVIIVEPGSARREIATGMGFSDVIDPQSDEPVDSVFELTNGRGAGVVFTACPVVETHSQALKVVARRGVVNFFGGVPKNAPPIAIFSNHIHYREAVVTGSHGSTPEQHSLALSLLAEKLIDLSCFITHRFPLTQIDKAISTAKSGIASKVIVQPSM